MPKSEAHFIIVYTTFPHRRQATSLAKNLIKEKLIACANIFKIDSIYTWEEKIEKAREYGVFLKTREELYSHVETKIKEAHPYEVPCIISWKLAHGSKEFLKWIAENVANGPNYSTSDN